MSTEGDDLMPTFPTPHPIELRVRIAAGEVTIVAEDRDDTQVEVRPSNPGSRADVEAAEATRIDHRDGTVVVEGPSEGRLWLLGRSPSLDVHVALPEASSPTVDTKSAEVRCHGWLGRTSVETASGDVLVEHAADLTVKTASGDVSARQADGDAKLGTASGDILLTDLVGDGDLTSASGDIAVGRAGGDIRVKTASGDASIGEVDGSVSVKTASGDAHVKALRRGTASFDTASGDVHIGIVEGTAAWLDVQSMTGDVRSVLDAADGPVEGGESVRVRARTVSGDVVITRAD